MARRAAAILALLLAVAVPLGCASDSDDEERGETTAEVTAGEAEADRASELQSHIDSSDAVKAFHPSILKDGDVNAQPQGTPGRALLEWWQAFQFRDAARVQELTSRETLSALGADAVAELVRRKGIEGIAVLGVTTDGAVASVNAALLRFTPPKDGAPPPRKPTESRPATFTMTKEGGRWVFAATEYLAPKVEALKAAEQQP